jgi:hypothetical protein
MNDWEKKSIKGYLCNFETQSELPSIALDRSLSHPRIAAAAAVIWSSSLRQLI